MAVRSTVTTLGTMAKEIGWNDGNDREDHTEDKGLGEQELFRSEMGAIWSARQWGRRLGRCEL